MFRALALSAFVAVAAATPAMALEARDLTGQWATLWANNAGENLTGGGPLHIAPDSSPDSLDGRTPASGFDGVMNGEVSEGPDGSLIWQGRWASLWPEGVTWGDFRFQFTDANNFRGLWSTDDGEVRDALWVGQRVSQP